MRKIRNLSIITLILILGILINFFNSITTTEAKPINNINSSMYLNPKWIEYYNLTEEEKQKYQVVPEKYLINYDEITARKTEFSRFVSGAETLSYYNLMDENLVTEPRDQGSTGLCWAFSALSSVESNLLITGISNKTNPLTFSERQLDYAIANKIYIDEEYSPYYLNGRTSLGTGAYTITPYDIFSNGVSPVATENFENWNENLTSTKSISDVLDTNLVDYTIDGFYYIGGVNSNTSYTTKQYYVQALKNHIASYGSVTIGTIGPHPYYAGSCVYFDQEKGTYLLNDLGNCNSIIKENGHAMSIIGWDDNYEYEYCRTTSSTNDNLDNCSNIVTGKGAFILKNSWGDNVSYPYLAYTSNVDSALGITGMSEKNWTTNYELRRGIEYNYDYSTSIITYHKSSRIKEELKKITFYNQVPSSGKTYTISISKNGGVSYTKIGTVLTTYYGMYDINLSNYILDTDSFTIKITSSNGYASEIYAFTDYIDESTDIIADTKILTGNEYSSFIANLELITATRNIPSGEFIQYQLLDEDGVDITSLMTIENNVTLNNVVTPLIKFSERINSKKVVLNTIYKGQVMSSNALNITRIEDYFKEGTGSEEEPIIINSLDEFLNIGKSETLLSLNYKLAVDLDFSTIKDYNTTTNFSDGTFTGTFDGDNHTLRGLTCSSSWCSVFYETKDAIIKNLTISDFKITSTDDTNSISSFLVYNAEYTQFINITILNNNSIITDSLYVGSLVTIASDSYFYHVSNYANIESTSASSSYVGGILGIGYGCKIEESYNYGNINATKAVTGGLVGVLVNNTDTGMTGDIKNSYNRGDINSSNISGGLIGQVGNSIITTSYSTSNLNRTCNLNDGCAYGNLIGLSFANCLKDLYYLKNGIHAYYYYNELINEHITAENITALTETELKDSSNYINFDFENIWTIENEYAFLKNYHYSQVSEIILPSEVLLEVGKSKKLKLEIIPTYAKENQIQYSIENEEIASIDSSGNITGLKRGSTNILIDTIDGSDLHYKVLLKVTEQSATIQSYQVIEEKYILVDEFIDTEEFLSHITVANEDYEIELISEKETVSTGDILNIYYLEELVDNYVISVLGDVTGTGSVNLGDIAKTFQYIKEKITMEREYQIAADTTLDNKIKLNDIIKSFQYIKGKIESLGDE